MGLENLQLAGDADGLGGVEQAAEIDRVAARGSVRFVDPVGQRPRGRHVAADGGHHHGRRDGSRFEFSSISSRTVYLLVGLVGRRPRNNPGNIGDLKVKKKKRNSDVASSQAWLSAASSVLPLPTTPLRKNGKNPNRKFGRMASASHFRGRCSRMGQNRMSGVSFVADSSLERWEVR